LFIEQLVLGAFIAFAGQCARPVMHHIFVGTKRYF